MALPNASETPTVRVDQAAELLGISVRSAYDSIQRGEIPALHFGRRVVIPTAALLALLDPDRG